MSKTQNYQLINGIYNTEEAKEILLGMVRYKIQFHQNKVFSSDVRLGVVDKISNTRVAELMRTREDISALIEEVSRVNKKLSITSSINIEITD